MNQLLNKIIYGGGVVFDLTKWLIVALVIIILVNSFWVSIFVVDGQSMEPTLHNGEVVMMSKSFYRGDSKPARGDAVVVQYPGDPDNKKYVKRVIGLPGETVQISNGKVYLNKKLLREAYLENGVDTVPAGKWVLEESQYFLMGDNRNNSNDSRYFGPVEQRFFVGKALSVVIPSLRAIERPSYLNNVAAKKSTQAVQ